MNIEKLEKVVGSLDLQFLIPVALAFISAVLALAVIGAELMK